MKILLTYLVNRLRDLDLTGWPSTVGFLALIIYVMGAGLYMIFSSVLGYMDLYGIPANATPGDIWRSIGIW